MWPNTYSKVGSGVVVALLPHCVCGLFRESTCHPLHTPAVLICSKLMISASLSLCDLPTYFTVCCSVLHMYIQWVQHVQCTQYTQYTQHPYTHLLCLFVQMIYISTSAPQSLRDLPMHVTISCSVLHTYIQWVQCVQSVYCIVNK